MILRVLKRPDPYRISEVLVGTQRRVDPNKGSAVRTKWQSYGLCLAVVVFGIGLAASLWQGSASLQAIRVDRWLVVLGLTPVTIALNTLEFWCTARLIGRRLAWFESLRIVLIGSAGNLLPLPVGPAIRVAALRGREDGYCAGLSVTVLAGLLWAGIGLAAAATGVLLLQSLPQIIGVAGLIGAGVLVIGTLGLLAVTMQRPRYAMPLAVSRVCMVLVGTSRLFCCLLAVGGAGSWIQCLVLILAPIVAAAIMFVPNGLGFSETGVAGLAALVGVAPAAAFLAAALNRITGLLTTMISAMCCLARRHEADMSR